MAQLRSSFRRGGVGHRVVRLSEDCPSQGVGGLQCRHPALLSVPLFVPPEDRVHEVAGDLADPQVSLELVGDLVLSRLLGDSPLVPLVVPGELSAPVTEHHVEARLELVAHDGVGGSQLVQGDVPLLITSYLTF